MSAKDTPNKSDIGNSEQPKEEKGGRGIHKNKYALSEEEINEIALIEWEVKDGGKQYKLLLHCFNTNNHLTVYELLKLYKDKTHKFWVKTIRRALYNFKPPEIDQSVWLKFYELFQTNVNQKQYADAMNITLPILASFDLHTKNENENKNENEIENKENSLEKAYKMFKQTCSKVKSMDNNWNPSLRDIASLLGICCNYVHHKNMNQTYKNKAIKIAFNLYELSKEYKLDITQTTSTDYFSFLFEIFAIHKTPIHEFNILFTEFTQNINQKIMSESLTKSVEKYFNCIENIEIDKNLISDLNGYLFFDIDKTKPLQNIKLPKFQLSTLENSEIWEQLRNTQINDENALNYQNKQLIYNKTRMKKLGINKINNNKTETKTETKTEPIVFDEQTNQNHRRMDKYNQFIKYMLSDGGAQVIIDGANVGHMIKQNCFSFDFIDHIASYYHSVKNKKVRIVLSQYRCINAENCQNERVRNILNKWNQNNWLIRVPNILYDDILWSICALHSCLVYNGKIIIITNDEMRDHKMALNYKRIFDEFLETKLCRLEIFKEQNKLYYDPFTEFKNNNLKKRKANFDENDDIINKKQKLNNMQYNIIQTSHINSNFHSRYEYIHTIYPYKIHEPYPYVVKPQFYEYNIDTNNRQLIWFLPQICNASDIKNPQNMLKCAYSDKIIQQRIRWIVARLKRPLI